MNLAHDYIYFIQRRGLDTALTKGTTIFPVLRLYVFVFALLQ